MQQKIQLCGCLPAARLARAGKQQLGRRGACEQIPKLQPRQEAPFPRCRTLTCLVPATRARCGAGSGWDARAWDPSPCRTQGFTGWSLAIIGSTSEQRLPPRWEPPQGKQLATVQEVLHRSNRGRAGVCITICRVIYISYINYPTCNLLTTPGLNIATLVKEKKKKPAVETSLTIRSQDNDMMICNWENKFFLAMQKSNQTIRTHQSWMSARLCRAVNLY